MKFFNAHHFRLSKGFTLIELLVVISIIGLLSSVILASLKTAREKAKDGAIKNSVHQMRNLLALEYSDKGEYTNLLSGWFGNPTDCSENISLFYSANPDSNDSPNPPANSAFSNSNYQGQAKEICRTIVSNSGGSRHSTFAIGSVPLEGVLWVGTRTGGDPQTFSIMAYLPGSKTLFCLDNRGLNSSTEGTGSIDDPGCYSAP